MSDAITTGVLTDPDQIWVTLDSFWRTRLVTADAKLVKYTTYATLVAYMSLVKSVSDAVSGSTNFTTPVSAVTTTWYPLVIFKDQYLSSSYRTYGSGDAYATGITTYGQAGVPKWVVGVDPAIVDVGALTNSIIDTSAVVDKSLFLIDNGVLSTAVDLFTIFTQKTDAASGRNYIVVWLRNAKLDYALLVNGLGWLLQYQDVYSESYDLALKYLYEISALGMSTGRLDALLNAAAGLPVVRSREVVRRVVTDGGFTHVITDTKTYTQPTGLTTVATVGTELQPYSGISSAVRVVAGADALALSSADLPGVLLSVALSTGQAAQLGFRNLATVWAYDALKPSPWRFPVSGDAAAVEQFWVDCWARQQASGVFLSAVYGLTYPGTYTVNPMQVALGDVADRNVIAVILDIAGCPKSPAKALERIFDAMPSWPIRIIQVKMPNMADATNVNVVTTPHVGYGSGLSDVYSFSALTDYQPLVTVC